MGAAMRRVMMTPTFAAGLGVVIAAVLAYPMARTVFRYSSPTVTGRCQPKECGVNAQGTPALASARPVQPLVSPSPHSPEPRGSGEGVNTPSSAPADQPVLDYQARYQGKTVFLASITVTSPSANGRWQLEFTYPSATILNVWGGTMVSSSQHVVVVQAPENQPGQSGHSGQQGPHIVVEVTGQAGPPTSGTFNGVPCRIVVDTAPGRSH